MKLFVFILLFSCFFGFSAVANAQLSALPQTNIEVSMTPENPGPNEVVYVSLVSYSTNINSSKITWMIDGKIQKSGVGQKSFTFTTGQMGSDTTLGILVETQEGEVIEKSITVKPASVDLIWESDGFVPPFYKGRPLFIHQNRITVVALPHFLSENGSEIGAGSLVYTWKKNGSVVESASGYGKNSYAFLSPLISRPITISVEVVSPDNSVSGSASLNLAPTDPSVLFYRKDPIYGIEFQRAVNGSFALGDTRELVVVGIPLFFGRSDISANNLDYKWSINGVSVGNAPGESTQVFRQNEGVVGTSNISLSIENPRKILQYTRGSFSLVFGQ